MLRTLGAASDAPTLHARTPAPPRCLHGATTGKWPFPERTGRSAGADAMNFDFVSEGELKLTDCQPLFRCCCGDTDSPKSSIIAVGVDSVLEELRDGGRFMLAGDEGRVKFVGSLSR